MTDTTPQPNDNEEQYIDRILESAEHVLELRKDSAEESYVTIEASTAVYLITRYRAMTRGNRLN